MRIARWSARLMCFQYDVTYQPGVKNQVANCLSRILLCSLEYEHVEEPALIAEVSPLHTAVSLAEFTREC